MPAGARKRGNKFRVVELSGPRKGQIVKNSAGTSVDGGGSADRSKVQKQATAINISQSRRRRR